MIQICKFGLVSRDTENQTFKTINSAINLPCPIMLEQFHVKYFQSKAKKFAKKKIASTKVISRKKEKKQTVAELSKQPKTHSS